MQIKFEVEFNLDEVKAAMLEKAVEILPKIAGYRVECYGSYGAYRAMLVKETETAEDPL